MRYHNQCISPGNVSYGTTTSVFHLAMCHTVPRPVYFTWQCVIRYHTQCNMTKYTGCGTVWHIPSWNTLVVVPHNTLSAEILWLWSVWHIAKWNSLVVVPSDILLDYTGRGTAWHIARWNTLIVVPYSILLGCTGCGTVLHIARLHWLWYRMTENGSYGTTTSVFHLAMYHTVPRRLHLT
jgi:hypothetical protein